MDKEQAVEAKSYQVYILECSDGTLYTGIARDAAARLIVHNSGKGAKYTKPRLPVRLLYTEPCPDKSTALKRERAIKKLTRSEKQSLICQEISPST
jgi:predicted GIY-YIG superfamily endonuclease